MATCPCCKKKIRPFSAPPGPKELGVYYVVCPRCETPLSVPAWVFVVPLILTIPVAVFGYVCLGNAGVVLAVLLVPGPLVLLLYTVEPCGEMMLDLRSDRNKSAPQDE